MESKGVSDQDLVHSFLSLKVLLGAIGAALTVTVITAVPVVFEAFTVQLKATRVGAVA